MGVRARARAPSGVEYTRCVRCMLVQGDMGVLQGCFGPRPMGRTCAENIPGLGQWGRLTQGIFRASANWAKGCGRTCGLLDGGVVGVENGVHVLTGAVEHVL
eukprot:4137485-Pyramimonas_sp.AAC.2